jgi:hypothetical protein
MNTLNSDYETLREKNEYFEKERVEMTAKIISLEEKLA